MIESEGLAAWLRLTLIPGIGGETQRKLLAAFGLPEAIFAAGRLAVRGVVGFAFDRVKLHRLEAACLPTNLASRRVLEKSGFRNEGRARAYLKINGEWADHFLFGLVEDEFDRTGRDPSS